MDEIKVMEAGPQGFRGAFLDQLLAKGYFRECHRMVAKDSEQDGFYGNSPMYNWVCMLRYPVCDDTPSSSIRKIRNRCARFGLTISTGEITPELEDLYRRYHESVDFPLPATCRAHLYEGESAYPFDTHILEVRDGGRLIAAGFFDRGFESIMGVLNIYDPEYESYSLGKYLMDRKIQTARSEGLRYFYPGYIMISNDRFDYKLCFNREYVQVYLSADDVWEPFKKHNKMNLERFLLIKHFDLDLNDLFPNEWAGPWD